MKLQSLIVIFIIIILPIIILTSLYISNGLRTIQYQAIYDEGLLTAAQDAIYAFEQNTVNDKYSDNPNPKREIIKASIKMFEKSLANTCGISSYNVESIEEYIPAIVFGLYDGFYIYAPSETYDGKYTHNLRNYVYYSEILKGIGKDDTDIIIRYTLDNYVTVSGDFGDDEDDDGIEDGYKTKSGYLIVEDVWKNYIENSNVSEAKEYYYKSKDFTDWFNGNLGEKVKDKNNINFLKIDSNNDPENEESLFVEHKRTVIKQKIEGVLNSTITAYSKKIADYNYKMPKFSEEEWNRIYNNISIITFFQGKNIGYTKYNGYCVLKSTNSIEYVNQNLMYFIEGEDDSNHYYHDIRCSEIKDSTQTLTGYKIGAFREKKLNAIKDTNGTIKKNDEGQILYDDNGIEVTNQYKYEHMALACYECINGQLGTFKSVYDYINDESTDEKIKKAYYTSLARERYNQIHL